MLGRRNAPLSDQERARLASLIDINCADAASKISTADVLLLCTGAGFSADSGLAVYADVAEIDAYKALGLQYHDICQPQWLDSNPDLFWGFWGQCFNDYRDTAPHDGYEIIERWVERRFRHSEVAKEIRKRLTLKAEVDSQNGQPIEDPTDAYSVTDHAGAFFVFTSNVDAHNFDWFRACEIHECHGNTELYQCTDEDCPRVWRAPLDFRFHVDKATMLASAGPATANTSLERVEVNEDVTKPAVGRVKGGGRPRLLQHMPGDAPGCLESGFTSNYPTCPTCGAPARPSILMFGDWAWKEMNSQALRYQNWIKSVTTLASEFAANGSPLQVVVLELGAGTNVPTVRMTAEGAQQRLNQAGAEATLFRMNAGEPLGRGNGIVSIMEKCLPSLRKIDALMPDAYEA